MPFLSRHIGSTPGDGLSGMHVQPLEPCLSTFMDGMSITVASFAMAAGAADNALLILSASVVGGATGPTFGADAAGLAGGAALAGVWDCIDAAPTAQNAITPHNATKRIDMA